MLAVAFGIFTWIYYTEEKGVNWKIESILNQLIGGNEEFGGMMNAKPIRGKGGAKKINTQL